MSTTYTRTLDKLAALATAPSAADNERAVSRSKFDLVAARHGITKTVEEWITADEITHVKVKRGIGADGWAPHGMSTAWTWNPARFESVSCPRCGAITYLVPKYGTKTIRVAVTLGNHVWRFFVHDRWCPVVVAEQIAGRVRRNEELRARLAARKVEIAADPEGWARREQEEERRMRPARRLIATERRRMERAKILAKAAADKATDAVYRRAEAAVENTRRWRAANPEHARRLNREAQRRHRERVRAAQAATVVAPRT